MKERALEGNLIAVNISLYAMEVKREKKRVNTQDFESRILQQCTGVARDV